MKLTQTTEQDIERLVRWIEADPYHKDCLNPYWWLTGMGVFAFCLQDKEGPLSYVRLDEKDSDGLIRLHTQFGPVEEVSKSRLVVGMLDCIPVVQQFCKDQNGTGIIFQSVSPSLISFMKKKFRFEDFGQDDFVWRIEQAGT
jgi:hypothetical protein